MYVEGGAGAVSPRGKDISELRVLMVEDETIYVRFVIAALVKLGISPDNIHHVTSLADARQNLAENRYDILLTDNDFFTQNGDAKPTPNLGLELLKDEGLPSIKVMYSGRAVEEVIVEAKKYGAHFMTKDPQQLYQHLAERLAALGYEPQPPTRLN